MKTRNGTLKASALALAVQGVLAAVYAMPAQAQDAAGSLKAPQSFIDFGVIDVSRSSAKFGEYNGLDKSGGYLNGGFGVRGGDGYGNPNGVRRWEIRGDDLGLTSRSLGASISDQGRWSFGINFDQLRHNTSDSYQTPYTGSMGGNSFTLPNFGLVSTSTATGQTRSLSAAQLSQFQTMKIHNDRDNTSLTGGLIFNREWSMKADFNHLEQSGAKLTAFGSSATVGAGVNGEKVSILPMPTNYKTDTANVALNWLGEKGNATLSYYGSFFRNGYDNGVTVQTWSGATATQTISTAPSNNFQQLSAIGGYALSKRTKFAGGLSYSRATQNIGYAVDAGQMTTASPTSSANALVVNTHADIKITDQTTKDLVLSGGLKYDKRDNRTPSNIYNFHAIDGTGHDANYPNAPLSIKKTQLELAGDYRINMKQKVRLAYNYDDTHRNCNQYATGGGGGNPLTGGAPATNPPYAPGTNCVSVTETKEDRIGGTWRYRAAEGVNLNAGYTYANRKSTRDENARAPFIGLNGNTVVAPALPGLVAPGISGINADDFRGFNPFFEASRKENLFKLGANWDINDKWSVGANGRYADDKYGTTYGAQKGHQWSLNLDTSYAYREDGSVSAYFTQQERTRDTTNVQKSATTTATAAAATTLPIPSGATWSNSLKDTDTTIGLALKQGGLMGGKLDLLGDLSYSWTKSSFVTTFNYAPFTTTGLTCSDPQFLTCGALPDITSRLTQFRLAGTYAVTKTSKIRLGWTYQRLSATDFYYNGLQNGFTPTSVLPTNQTAPSYTVNMLYATFVHEF